jgi:hypothetical protein
VRRRMKLLIFSSNTFIRIQYFDLTQFFVAGRALTTTFQRPRP